MHEGIRYPCEQCDCIVKTRPTTNLLTLFIKTHLGIEYQCKHCDYIAPRPEHLQKLYEAIHEGVKYLFDKLRVCYRFKKMSQSSH